MSRFVPIPANAPTLKAAQPDASAPSAPVAGSFSSAASIDIEAIVRRVFEQLRQTGGVAPPSSEALASVPLIDQQVFSLEDVHEIAGNIKHIKLAAKTVVTPAAKDELRHRGISFEKAHPSTPTAGTKNPNAPGTRAIDLQRDGGIDEGMFSAVKKQVFARNIRLCNQASVTVILSDRPATTAHSRISPDACVVSINRVDDVPRFLAELSPNVFVLDVVHLHLVSLAAAIAAIAKPASAASGQRPKITVAGGLS